MESRILFATVAVLLVVAAGAATVVLQTGGTQKSVSTGPGSTTKTTAVSTTSTNEGGPVSSIFATAPGLTLKPLGSTGQVTLSKDGLNLGLYVNSEVVKAGSSVEVMIYENNPNGKVRVPAANNWPVPGLSLGPCGTLNAPMGVGILAGYYTGNNISSVTSGQLLALYQPGTYNCPDILSGVTGYSFAAGSETAGILQDNGTSPTVTEAMNANVTASGYWTSAFSFFQPGYYTVVGGDEWGTLLISHILVVQPILLAQQSQQSPLRFILSLNATRMVSGHYISIRALINNTLPLILSVNGSSDLPWSHLGGPCLAYAGIAILRGHYTQTNFTAGTPLQLYPFGLIIPCLETQSDHYVFQPLSDQALLGNGAIFTMGDGFGGTGYYAPGQTCDPTVAFCGNEKVTPFEPGTCTVVAGDEWGQLALGYFQVTAPPG
ncbi:MAG: hypothetical protein KGI38_08345 [Thaumarchaeota archaeon]|nr:hypothetical protein [Nitrososphaerota archaeon]